MNWHIGNNFEILNVTEKIQDIKDHELANTVLVKSQPIIQDKDHYIDLKKKTRRVNSKRINLQDVDTKMEFTIFKDDDIQPTTTNDLQPSIS